MITYRLKEPHVTAQPDNPPAGREEIFRSATGRVRLSSIPGDAFRIDVETGIDLLSPGDADRLAHALLRRRPAAVDAADAADLPSAEDHYRAACAHIGEAEKAGTPYAEINRRLQLAGARTAAGDLAIRIWPAELDGVQE